MVILSRETILAGLEAARRIQAGASPTAADMATAPLLDAWMVEQSIGGICRLVGMVTGHPSLPDGFCRTSVLLVIDDDCKWARTVSRLYALGRPLQEAAEGQTFVEPP